MDMLKSISLSVFYVVLFSLTVLCVAATALLLFRNSGFNASHVMTFFIFSLMFAYISLIIKRKKRAFKNNQIENLILNLAIPNNGLITSAELAANSSIGLKVAADYLESCYVKGICEKRFTEKDLVEVYLFKSAITQASKVTAKPISEIRNNQLYNS